MIRIDAVDRQRRRIEIGAFERFDVIANRFSTLQCSIGLRIDEYCCNFEQGVCLAVEATGLHVDGDGKKAAKPLSN